MVYSGNCFIIHQRKSLMVVARKAAYVVWFDLFMGWWETKVFQVGVVLFGVVFLGFFPE